MDGWIGSVERERGRIEPAATNKMEPYIDRSIEGRVWFDMLSISIDEFECANQSTRRMGRPVGRRLREQLGGWPGMGHAWFVGLKSLPHPITNPSNSNSIDQTAHFTPSIDRPNNLQTPKPRPTRRQPNRNSNAALGILPSSPFAISSPSASLACTHPSALYVTRADRASFDRQDQQHTKSLGRALPCTYRCDARGALTSSIPFLAALSPFLPLAYPLHGFLPNTPGARRQ